MGFAKYFEDNYDIYLERTERARDYDLATEAEISISISPFVRVVKNSALHINTDERIICKECGASFVFTVGEQKFYEKHNLCSPKRCRRCRDLRRKKAS